MKVTSHSALVTAVSMIVFATARTAAVADGAKVAPINAAVSKTLEASGYQSGDLLDKAQVSSVVRELIASGYEVPHAKAILSRLVADDSPLRKQFDTAGGKHFLRKIGKIPGGYARLERLAALPQGSQLVRQLQSDPGGDKLIEYLATTSSGHRLGSMTAKAPHGVNLNKPTGRIYTSDDLLKAIDEALREKPEPTAASSVKSLPR